MKDTDTFEKTSKWPNGTVPNWAMYALNKFNNNMLMVAVYARDCEIDSLQQTIMSYERQAHDTNTQIA